MNAPADLARVNASTADALHGYKSYTLGAPTSGATSIAHIGWTTNDGRRSRTRWTSPTSCAR